MKLPSMIKGWLNPAINPEKLLVSYFATGEQKYLALLVDQFNLPLFHYLLSQSDKALAEDILQTTWLKVIQAQAKMKQPTATNYYVKSWLFTIARNCLIDELKRQNRWQYTSISATVIDDEAPTTTEYSALISTTLEKTIAQEDKLIKFNQAIAQLPFHQREVFIFQQEGFSLLEIAALIDDNFETVKSRLRYARSSIKQNMRFK